MQFGPRALATLALVLAAVANGGTPNAIPSKSLLRNGRQHMQSARQALLASKAAMKAPEGSGTGTAASANDASSPPYPEHVDPHTALGYSPPWEVMMVPKNPVNPKPPMTPTHDFVTAPWSELPPAPVYNLCAGCAQRMGAGTDPFIVSFRIRVQGGDDNGQKAQEISTLINTPHTEAAKTFAMSVSRVQHSTFPPVDFPTTTQDGGLPYWKPNAQATHAPGVKPTTTTQEPSILAVAQKAEAIAKQNVLDYDTLQTKLGRSAAAHSAGLLFGDGPKPAFDSEALHTTKPPFFTLGRLVYDAIVATPPPMTTAPPDVFANAASPAPAPALAR